MSTPGKHEPLMLPFFLCKSIDTCAKSSDTVRRPTETGSTLKIALNWESRDYCLQNPGLEFPCTLIPLMNKMHYVFLTLPFLGHILFVSLTSAHPS